MNRPIPQKPADRLPPHSLEMEAGVIGCCLVDPKSSIAAAMDKINPDGREFYDLTNRTVWMAIMALDRESKAVDVMLVAEYLRSQGKFDEVGGYAKLSTYVESTPSSASLPYYVDGVVEKYVLRRVLQTSTRAAAAVYEPLPRGGLPELLENTQKQILEAAELPGTNPVEPIPELCKRFVDVIEASKHRNTGLVHGALPTGWGYFDKLTMGLQKSNVYLIGGRPSTGKTSLLCSLILNLAVERNIPVAFMSLEMSRMAIVERLFVAHTRVRHNNLHTGMASEREYARILEAMPKIAKAPLWIDDTPGLTPSQVRTRARRLVLQHQCQIVLVDHLHEINVPEAKGDEKIQATEAGKAIRALSKDLNIPVVCAAQLSRNFEQEAAKSRRRIPRMTDLRGSGNLEQMADLIGILHIDEQRESDDGEKDKPREDYLAKDVWPVNIAVVKQRNGQTGPVKMTFWRQFMLYEDALLNTGSVEAAERKAAKRLAQASLDGTEEF